MNFSKKTVSFVIGVAPIVVGVAAIVFLFRRLWLILQQLWLIATIVNILTNVIISGLLFLDGVQVLLCRVTHSSNAKKQNQRYDE